MTGTSSILTIYHKQGGGEPISVSKIQEVDDRLLWIQCEEGDIVCFDKKREKTIPIQWGNGIEQENIYQFSSTGKRLYAIMTDGLHIVDVKSDGTMIIPEHKLLLPNKKLNKVISTKDDVLYFSDRDNQLIAYDTRNGKAGTSTARIGASDARTSGTCMSTTDISLSVETLKASSATT